MNYHQIKKLMIIAVDKSERWIALNDIVDQLNASQFTEMFIDTWTRSESNSLNLDIIEKLIVKKNINIDNVYPYLEDSDKEFYDNLPEKIVVYQGTTMESLIPGYSWSLDQKSAIWFANRCSKATPAINSGIVNKKDILFATNSRSEKEIVVFPENVMNIIRQKVGDYKANELFDVYRSVQSTNIMHNLVESGEIPANNPAAQKMINSYKEYIPELREHGFETIAQIREAFIKTVLGRSLS